MSSAIVTLNVGGTKFFTTKATLSAPFEPSCILARLFDERFAVDSEPFIDRSPTKFAFILEYLRNGEADETPQNMNTESLLREAKYFGLLGLVSILEQRSKQEVESKLSFKVGTVSTLLAGEPATVKNVGSDNHVVLNFGIPRGYTGPPGPMMGGAQF